MRDDWAAFIAGIMIWAFVVRLIWVTCPTVEHQETTQAIADLNVSVQALADGCNLTGDNIWDVSTEEKCPQVFCNSVGCWCDLKAYKKRDKIDITDPHKFDYIDELWKRNYLNWVNYLWIIK